MLQLTQSCSYINNHVLNHCLWACPFSPQSKIWDWISISFNRIFSHSSLSTQSVKRQLRSLISCLAVQTHRLSRKRIGFYKGCHFASTERKKNYLRQTFPTWLWEILQQEKYHCYIIWWQFVGENGFTSTHTSVVLKYSVITNLVLLAHK